MSSWPLAIREAIIHYFTFEYLQDGLVVVILNSISDLETIDKSTHGFTRDVIPDAEGVVRIDIVGGFAIQKMTPERSYFRTIANMDINLELAPPSFINFISRQLIGTGFKLFKKEVGSVSKGGAKFREALKDPIYARIRHVLYSENTYTPSLFLENPTTLEERSNKTLEDNSDNCDVGDKNVPNEIEALEENHTEENGSLDHNTHEPGDNLTNEIRESFGSKIENKVQQISPKVEKALQTLEKAIFIVRDHNNTVGKGQKPDANTRNSIYLQDDEEAREANQTRRNNENCCEPAELAPFEEGSSPFQVNQKNGTIVVQSNGERSNNMNGTKRRNRKSIFCC